MSTETQQSAQSAREVVERLVMNAKAHTAECATSGGLKQAIVNAESLLAQPPSDTVARLVEAAGEVADSLQSTKQHIARAGAIAVPEDADVKRLCALHGYGAIMDAAARAWALKDPVGSFVVGPCAGVILPELTALEAAIAAHRASVDALFPGLLPVTIARVNAALDASVFARSALKWLGDHAESLLAAARELLAREARTILWVEAATDGLTNLYVRDGDRLRFGGAFTSEEAAIAAVTRTTSTLVEIDDLARRYEVAAEENAMLRAALAAKHRCDTPDCPNDAVVGLCWDHGLTPLDGATATLKVCLEAECVERQKAEAERDALREDLGAEQAKVAALEARLAEVGPVVEAAERQAKEQPGPGTRLTPEQRGHYDPDHLAMLAEKYPWLRATVDVENAVRAMLAARAKREVDAMGKGGTPTWSSTR